MFVFYETQYFIFFFANHTNTSINLSGVNK
nr:MAG TPA: hypothetical protein [Caudoviricetes sp.]